MTNGEGAVVKLGGSIVTDKASSELRVDDALVRRLGTELFAADVRPLVVVHGAGSFGHRIVQRTDIHRGLSGRDSLLAMGETQRLQYELDSHVAFELMGEGLPVFPIQASAAALMKDGQLVEMDTRAIEVMVDRGLVPLLYGVPAVDIDIGCSILSGDQLAPYVARALGIGRVVHATDVDGVYDQDPSAPEARRIERIDRGNWDLVRDRLAGSGAVDVTGGMAGKVAALLEHARAGLTSRIVDGRIPGRLTAALAGEQVGTLICWETE